MKINKVAEILQNKLLESGIIIHRYNAYSTDSIYLKLDYGALNSIRISDHTGKKHLSYKYNVIKNIQNGHWEKDGKFWRYYCGTSLDSLNVLVDIICRDRQYKKCFSDYNKLIESFKVDIGNQKGFWNMAWEVGYDTSGD